MYRGISDTHTTTTHPFEKAGLGRAPFKFFRFEVKIHSIPSGPSKPGSSCDYCATSIKNVYWIRSADDKEFKVGCECVKKTTDKKSSLHRTVDAHARKIQTRARKECEAVRIESAKTALTQDTVRAELTSQPHPKSWLADKGLTKLDWAEWMLKNAGNRGRLEVAKVVEKL